MLSGSHGGGGCRPYFFLIKVFYCKWHGQTKQGSREARSSILGGIRGNVGGAARGGGTGGKGWGTLVQGAAGGWGMCCMALGARDRGHIFPALQQGWLLHPWVISSPHRHCRVQKGSPPPVPCLPQVEKPPGVVPRGTQILGPAPQGAQGQDTQLRAWARGHFSFPVGFFSLHSPGRGHPRRCPHHEHTDGFSWCARCP